MKIKKVTVHNYRSIKHCEVDCRNILVVLGQNNHGKSNILRAIEFALTSSAKPTKKDLHAFHDPDDTCIWVELAFDRLCGQRCPGLGKRTHSGRSLPCAVKAAASF